MARGQPVDNAPRASASFDALRSLCEAVLDPLWDALGQPILTYGFAGPRLNKLIAGRIAPKLDQHAACEVNALGQPICGRLGASVDLYLPGMNTSEVGRWIASSTSFDRLYFYGDDRPLHVSHGPQNSRVVVEMVARASGRRTPRILRW